ncbi:MAG: ATP-binding protein [Bacteroidales bacterium]
MPNIKQSIAAARNVYDIYWESYAKGDMETFVSTLDKTYEMIGTSENEICHTKAEGIEFLKGQIAEVVGKAELRNRKIDVVPLDQLMLVNEHSDIYVLADTTWGFYSKIRISTLLRETEGGWKVVQQHGSLPDIRVQEGETMAIEKISRENLELRDAVRRRTEFVQLGHEAHYFWYMRWLPEKDEYLRLAYHGLRAKNSSFNATMKTDFDESLGRIIIIPQDIGRVILNLITNAFYAVDEKKKQLASDLSALSNLTGQNTYEPTVSVSTRKTGNNVLISVKDNGPGIPEEIKDKIFQPFFTTKKGTEGTGLGLSITNDIVKAHGGELKVETKPARAVTDGQGGGLHAGEAGTAFIIQLPMKIGEL